MEADSCILTRVGEGNSFTCQAGSGRPPPLITWEFDTGEDPQISTYYSCHPQSNGTYCSVTDNLIFFNGKGNKEVKCTVTQGYPFDDQEIICSLTETCKFWIMGLQFCTDNYQFVYCPSCFENEPKVVLYLPFASYKDNVRHFLPLNIIITVLSVHHEVFFSSSFSYRAWTW